MAYVATKELEFSGIKNMKIVHDRARLNLQLNNSMHISCLISRYSDQELCGSATHTQGASFLPFDLDLYILQSKFQSLGWLEEILYPLIDKIDLKLPRRKVNGSQRTSNTPGISHTRTTTKKETKNLPTMTALISLYL